MSGRARKGEAFILILLILIGLILFFVWLPTRFAQVRAAPLVQHVFWQVNGRRVTSVSVGVEVEAHVVVEAVEEYVGSVIVKIRKDISFWWDRDHSIQTEPVNLRGGQEIEFELKFVPDEASGGSLRGYFVEVEFPATRTSWVMKNSYPPRLKVT